MRRTTTGGGRRRAVVRRRAWPRRAGLLAALVVAHVALIGGVQAGLPVTPDAGGTTLTAPHLLPEADAAAGEVQAGAVPTPGVAPVIRPSEPAVPVIPDRASGRFAAAGDPGRAVPDGAITYRVEVEQGLPYAVADFARAVDRTLGDDRSWAARTGRPMARVGGDAEIRILLASPKTTDRLCAPLDTGGKVSCRNGENVVINALRWATGAPSYAGDVAAYRLYVINHEVGHALGHGHVGCTGPDEVAPVMLQQTLGLGGCRANPWPKDDEVR